MQLLYLFCQLEKIFWMNEKHSTVSLLLGKPEMRAAKKAFGEFIEFFEFDILWNNRPLDCGGLSAVEA
jgi:hypothetical protein